MEIEIQYMDKEKNIKGSKKVKVKYDWKPLVCTHCKVFRHESKQCNKGSNADIGKSNDDDYNHSKERNNVEGNCKENQHMNDGFVMQNRRIMYNKDLSKKGNPSMLEVLLIISERYHYKCFYTFVYAANDGIGRRSGDSVMTTDMMEFHDCINKIEVDDLCKTGLHFTWTKNLQETRASNMTGILKKLDRVMINEDFIKQYPQAHAKFLPYVISDHTPDILCIPTSIKKKVKPLRFSNFLTNKLEFIDIVKENWKLEVPGYFMYQVVMKLKSMKSPLNKLSWSKGNLFKRVETLRGQLQEVQTKINQVLEFNNLVNY
uniref:RNA-directed DNA polymerase, eukaryota, reverse transcriptase zinc-binding domain protein n=1 Tax=Tanacetum cinerariifolium TaxID=118510 RepID=A0A699K2M1_TANCI|nr:hypothetical protein [Tanacetum cinerariifolium]